MVARLGGFSRRVLREIVPHGRRPQLRVLYNELTWWMYAGNHVACPCCDGRFGRFRPWFHGGRAYPMCPRCGSLGRHRVDWLFLRDETNLCSERLRLLHIAPEPSLAKRFQALPNVSYISGDYDSALAMERIDITDIRYPDESFDAIVCNHVLEHVVEDRTALREIHRVLTPGGWALLQSPVDSTRAETFEDPDVTDSRERERVFGQHDHVRIYGRDYSTRLAEAGFEVSESRYAARRAPAEVERFGLDVDEVIYFCRKDALEPELVDSGAGSPM